MFLGLPFLRAPARAHPRVRTLQGVVLSLFAPVGWLTIEALQGNSPVACLTEEPGLYAYMLLGTMTAFGFFGRMLGREEERLARLATLDELTALPNSRLFGQRLEECVAASLRSSRPVSLMLLDMDHFKAINDTHGHQAGNMALQAVSKVLKGNVRSTDVPARVGGEEFAVILPDTSPDEASQVGQRVLEEIRAMTLSLGEDRHLRLSASIGLSGGIVTQGQSAFALFAQADKALYQAKDQGRDRLVAA